MRRTKSLEDKIQGQISKYGDLFSVEYDENGFSVSCTICEKQIKGNEKTVRTLLKQHIVTRRHRVAVQQVVPTQGTVSQSLDEKPLGNKPLGNKPLDEKPLNEKLGHCHTDYSEYHVDRTPVRGGQSYKSFPSMATVGTVEHHHPSSDPDSEFRETDSQQDNDTHKTSAIYTITADSNVDRDVKKLMILKLRSQIRRNEAEATFYESVTDRLDIVLNTIVEQLSN